MNKIYIEKCDEYIYEHILDNGFKIILYPTTKTKNFYCTISTRFGAKVNDYKINDKKHKIIPGTAHFLEHKVMDISGEDKDNIILNSLGSSPNAYTSYEGTTYNVFGTKEIKENIRILFDKIFKFKLNEKSVENEKKIINEEIDMLKDILGQFRVETLHKNLFHDNFLTKTILGEKEDIKKMNKTYLMDIYKTFYTPENMFCVITGNFNPEEICNYVTSLVSNIKPLKDKITIIEDKEPDEVKVNYSEIEYDVEKSKINIAYKVPKKNIKQIDYITGLYSALLMNSLFSLTSEFYEKNYKKDLFVGGVSAYARMLKDHIIFYISATSDKPEDLIEEIKNTIKNMKITKDVYERKVKGFIADMVLSFEDIEDLGDMIISHEVVNKIKFQDIYKLIEKHNYEEFKNFYQNLDFKNYSTLKLYK